MNSQFSRRDARAPLPVSGAALAGCCHEWQRLCFGSAVREPFRQDLQAYCLVDLSMVRPSLATMHSDVCPSTSREAASRVVRCAWWGLVRRVGAACACGGIRLVPGGRNAGVGKRVSLRQFVQLHCVSMCGSRCRQWGRSWAGVSVADPDPLSYEWRILGSRNAA